jgi:hypothetical protein
MIFWQNKKNIEALSPQAPEIKQAVKQQMANASLFNHMEFGNSVHTPANRNEYEDASSVGLHHSSLSLQESNVPCSTYGCPICYPTFSETAQ